MHSVNPAHSYPLLPFIKGGSSTYSKLMEMGVGGGGLKTFARKGGSRQNGGGCLEMEDCHIILRFFLRFLMMEHKKNP